MKYILALFAFIPSLLFADLIDIDEDGLNDIIVVDKNNSSWTYSAYTSSSNFTLKVELESGFSTTKRAAVIGKWSSDSFTPAAVRLKNNNYSWLVGSASATTLGKKSNKILLGVDHDLNGITDVVVYKKSGEFVVNKNAFSGSSSIGSGNIGAKRFKKGTPVALVPPVSLANGTSGTVFGVVISKGENTRKKVSFYSKDLNGNVLKSSLGRVKGEIIQVSPIKYNNSSEGILLLVKNNKNYKLLVYTVDGSLVASRRYSKALKNLTVGNFTTASGEEIYFKKGKKHFIVNLFTSSLSTSAIISEEKSISGRVLNEDLVLSPDSSEAVSTGSLGSVCKSINNLSTGVLWKPDSDVGDARGGKPVVLFQGGFKPGTNSIAIYAVNGEQVATFTFKAPNEHGINGNSDHYYAGWTGSSGLTGGQIADAAQAAAGDPEVYFSGPGTSCFGPVHPDSRSGSIG